MSQPESESEHTVVDPLSEKRGKTEVSEKVELYPVSATRDVKEAEAGVAGVQSQAPAHNLTGIKFALVFVGLALSVFLAALDQTIVATTLNTVGNEFQAFPELSWIGTAYLLTATGFGPSWGRLSDVFGRKYTYLAAIFLFETGSAICGAAPNINVLIVGRAIAGLGGGGILGLTLIIITDMVSIRETGKFAGVLGACFGISSIVGPLLGGAFTDHVTWRWAYYINLPIGGVAAAVVFMFLNLPHHRDSTVEKLKKIDYLGSFLILAAIILALIAVSWGGSTYSWSSYQVLVPLILGIALLVAFTVVETFFASFPIMPVYLFKNRTVLATFSACFAFGGAFFGIVYYTPLFFQVVRGDSATTAGLELIPLVLSVVVFVVLGGGVVSKTGRYLPFMIGGMIVATVGVGLLTTWTASVSNGAKIGYLFMAGLGFGWNIQNIILVAQNAVEMKDVAVVTAAATFFRTLGGTIAIAVMQSVFNSQITSGLAPYEAQLAAYGHLTPDAIGHQPELIRILPESLSVPLTNVYVVAITRSFFVSMAMSVFAALSLFLVENRPLRTLGPNSQAQGEVANAQAQDGDEVANVQAQDGEVANVQAQDNE